MWQKYADAGRWRHCPFEQAVFILTENKAGVLSRQNAHAKNCGNTNTIRQTRRKIDLAVLVVGIPEYDRLVAACAITQDGIVLDRFNMRTVPVGHIETNRILLNMDVTTADSYKRCYAKGVRLCRNRDLWI